MVVAFAAATLLIVYGLFNPETAPFPRCPFLMLTGWQCPGCGSQRAIHALLHADISRAWHFNAALVVSLPLLAFMAVASLAKEKHPAAHRLLNSQKVCLFWLIALVAWAVIRNF